MRRPLHNPLIIRQKVVLESEKLTTIEPDPNHFGAVYSIESIRQGRPEPPKQLIADVFSAEFRLHVILLQLQGLLSQIRKSFQNRLNNQLSREFRYYQYENGMRFFSQLVALKLFLKFSDDFCGHGSTTDICQTCLQRGRCRRMRDILQLPSRDNTHKRLFLELFIEYLRQIFLTKIFQDCSTRLRENWLPRLFNRAKLFIFELGNQNLDIGDALNGLVELCQSTLVHFNLNLTLYASSFNSITVNPLLTSGFEIRFHYYFTISIGHPVSPLSDEALNSALISRLNRSLTVDPEPHLRSSFLGSPENDL